MSTELLFRPEVLAEKKRTWLGPVLLLPKISHHVYAGFAAFASVSLLVLLFFATFPRKVRVSGWVVPEGGLVQVYSPSAGVITDVAVGEGAQVKKGDRLVVVSTDRESSTMGFTGEQVARQLNLRKDSLVEDRRNIERLTDQQRRSLTERLETLKSSDSKILSEISLQRVRLWQAGRTVTRQKALMKQSVGSTEQVQMAEEGQVEQMARLKELERSRLLTQRDRQAVQAEIDELPIKMDRDLAAIDRNIASVQEQIAQLAGQRELVLSAQTAGTVTALQAKRGGNPDTRTPLLAIMPEGSKLEAHIFCSSRAVGFLKVGQSVLLRYESFPYQKFGHYEGTVSSIAQSAVSVSELAPQIASVARAAGNDEAVYRITVVLKSQSVQAYGKAVPIHPGMQLDADVVLENRRLIEWMLEPLFTVSGSWKR
jgi:membrane fusion protein